MLLCVECLSLSSYNLEDKAQGFGVTLGAHEIVTIRQTLCTHKQNSGITIATYLALLDLLSSLASEVLKLCDHQLLQWHLIQ